MNKIIQFSQVFSCLTEGLRIASCLLSSSKKGWANDSLHCGPPTHRLDHLIVKSSLPRVIMSAADQANDDSTMAVNEDSYIDVDCVLRFGRAIWICTRHRHVTAFTNSIDISSISIFVVHAAIMRINSSLF